MQRLHERLGPKGLKIVAVSVDDPGGAQRIREFADELGLSFELLHDASKGIDAYQGEVVLLNIWATWCGPCRIEMPSMQRLQERLGPKGLRIVAVSVDDPGQAGAIRRFAQELGLTFDLLHDPTKTIERTYQTTGVPETFLIGRDGTIRRRSIGAEAWDSEANVAQLERLLAEQRP